MLYRAGKILQDIFYSYREMVYDKYIVKIEEKNGTLYLREGQYPDIKSALDVIFPFPKDLVTTEEDKKAVLVHLACSDAVAWMHDLVEYFLKG